MDHPEFGVFKLRRLLGIALPSVLVLTAALAEAQTTIDAGTTGFDAKRPVLAAACEHGCPWGELGDFIVEATKPFGYDVVLCRNCNGDQGPPLVSAAAYPPALGATDLFVGTDTRVNVPVDFGVTESGLLAWAYEGRYDYQTGGPYSNLRLIAKIEDPTYLLVAVKASSTVASLADIATQKLGVKMIGGDTPISKAVLDHFGLTADAIKSWGGSLQNSIVAGAVGSTDFDVIISELGSPSNNPESSIWPELSQKFDLRFLDLPETLLDDLANTKELGLVRVTAKWGFLRGVDHAIATVARSGEAFFAREDAPETAVYDVAKAIDENRGALKWFIRPYSYDPRTVWTNLGVPLHPGAARYYREAGYMPGSACRPGADASADGTPRTEHAAASSGCALTGTRARDSWVGLIGFASLAALVKRRTRAATSRRTSKRPAKPFE